MTDLYDELYKEICATIKEDVSVDIYGDIHGYEFIASALAFRINDLVSQVKGLEEDNERMKEELKIYDEELEEATRLKEW